MSGATGDARRIAILVGTDHHPFDRAVAWADDWQRRHPDDEVVIQFGRSRPPRLATGHDFLSPAQVRETMGSADVVITHGGPGTINDAQQSGHRPIVFPRHPDRGEHVDDHQQRFAAWCADRDLVDLAREVEDLERLLVDLAGTRAPAADSTRSEASVATFAELVGRRHVAGARPTSVPRVVLVLDGAAPQDGVDLERLPAPAIGLPVLLRRRLRRSERAGVLDYGATVRDRLTQVSSQHDGGPVFASADLRTALALGHDRQVDVAVVDRGLGAGERLALRRLRVPMVSPRPRS